MAKVKRNFEKVTSTVLPVVSGIAFILILWLLFYGKIKLTGILSPFWQKVPKNESEVVQTTEGVLGTAAQRIREGEARKWLERGTEVFEESEYTQPARTVRDNVKDKIDEVISDAKELPAKEIKVIQRQVCQEWLGDEIIFASESGENN